ASVGHHTDRTLLDDVAAVSCSTPTHAAEAAVGIDCAAARSEQARTAARLRGHAARALQAEAELAPAAARLRENARRAVLSRARLLATLSRAPGAHVERERTRLHQQLREIRAGSRRRVAGERSFNGRRALVVQRKGDSALLDCRQRRPRELSQLSLALAAHDPQRTLERGYAVVESAAAGEPLSSVASARAAHELRLRFADGTLEAQVRDQ
ncbi:MAG TPA: exodeoxyribonuclease VII large subunit, partial [Solirubrobacteraceae bacterium]